MPYIRVDAIFFFPTLERPAAPKPMKKDPRVLNSRYYLFFAAGLYAAGLAIALLPHAHSVTGDALRIVALMLAAAFAVGRRNMTIWILWSMFAGVELGLDTPSFALHLHVFSDIFLRLVKTIVAPLILGTLISGIAAHGSLKEVGRLGIKSLIYFEVMTTVALLVGLAAINISRAGVGLSLPTSTAALTATTSVAAQPAPPQSSI